MNYFKIPEKGKLIKETGKITTTNIHTMVKGRQKLYFINIATLIGFYTVVTRIYRNENNIVDTIETKVNYGENEEYEIYKAIRMHLKEIFKSSDIGIMLNRYYGVLSYKFIGKYLDDFIIKSIERNEKEFNSTYTDMVNTLILELSKAKDILKAINIDYLKCEINDVLKPNNDRFECATIKIPIPGNPPPRSIKYDHNGDIEGFVPIEKFIGYNKNDAKATQQFEKRIMDMEIEANPILKELLVDNDTVYSMVCMRFEKAILDDRIVPIINNKEGLTDRIALNEFLDDYIIGKKLIDYIVNNPQTEIFLPSIHKDELNIIFVEYNILGYGISVTVGNRTKTEFFEGELSDATIMILKYMNKFNYRDLYTDKKSKSIRNLWGLLG